jgi:hypothetical protein
MPQTIRKFWEPLNGRTSLNYNWEIIDHDSVVLISAAEYTDTNPPSNEHKIIGSASVTVENIAPHGPPFDPNHGVGFVVNINGDSPLKIVTDITVLDDKPIEIDDP